MTDPKEELGQVSFLGIWVWSNQAHDIYYLWVLSY